MTAYTTGYREGWIAYLKNCTGLNAPLGALMAEVHTLAEQAGQGLSNTQQGDYWLGFYHGRTAARTVVARKR